jgi:putative FmdB family regulatory protein
MPLYEYECTKCKHRFEERRKVTDPPASRCPECRGRVRRVYQPVGIIFKGSGFHVTDYGRSGEKKEKAEQPAPAAGTAKED